MKSLARRVLEKAENLLAKLVNKRNRVFKSDS
jgi:hypothetical protein